MRPRSAKYLEDIRDAAAFIQEVTRSKTLDEYREDRLLKQAVERNFEIVGEAVNRLTRDDPETAEKIANASQIVAFRNALIHGYDLIDDRQVWNTIQNDIPRVVQQIESLLKEAGNDD